jgi:hypothetical protein
LEVLETVTTFTVPPPPSLVALSIGLASLVIVIGVGAWFASRAKYPRRIRLAIPAFVVITLALIAVFALPQTGTITVSPGGVSVSSFPLLGAHFQADQVKDAYVTTLGNFSLVSRGPPGSNWGTAYWGDYSVGVFLGPGGQTCDVITGSPEVLVVQLTNGQCLVLGPQDLNGLVSTFSTDIRQVSS